MIKNISPIRYSFDGGFAPITKKLISGILALGLVACGGSGSGDNTHVNASPVTSAGSAQSIEENLEVTLSGSATDSDGSVVSFAWTQVSGPSVTLTDASSATTSFVAPEVTEDATLTFKLTATDNQGATGSSQVDVTVINVNLLPVVDAGSAQSVNEQNSVTLVGSATDSDGSIVSYQWSQTTGPSVQLNDETSATTSFIAPQVTSDTLLTFQLSATDNDGATSNNFVDVTVTNVNQLPTVNAGDDQTHEEGTQVQLTGNGADSDGAIVSYHWQQTAGTNAVLNDVDSPVISFNLPAVASDQTLTFTLTVTDNDGGVASDSVSINVLNLFKINELNFIDQNLAACVNEVAASENLELVEQIEQLNCANRNIKYLNGIEDIASLKQLDFSDNELRSVHPLLELTQLNYLDLQGNVYMDCDGLQEAILRLGQDVVLAPNSCLATGDRPLIDLVYNDDNLAVCVNEIASTNGWLYASQVTALNCAERQIREASSVSHLSNLQTLDLSGNYLTTVSSIGSLSKLTELNLANNYLGRVNYLVEYDNLASLDLSGNDKALCDDLNLIESVVSNLTRPTACFQAELIVDMEFEDPRLALCIDYLSVTYSSEVTSLTCIPADPDDEGADGPVANAYSKTNDSVDIWDPIYSIAGLERFPYLQSMRFIANRIEDISVLAELKHLDSVVLEYNQISNVMPLAQLKHLKELNLRYNNLTTMQLNIGDETVDMSRLETLNVEGNELTDADSFAQIDLSKLKTLKLSENSIADISGLAAITALESLFIDDNNITDVSVVANMPQLYLFNANNNQINSLEGFNQLTKLRYFQADRNQIKSFTELANLPYLESINLDRNQVDGSGDYSGLEFPSVRDLYLADNKLTNLDFMKGTRWDNLIFLSLYRNQINNISGLEGHNSLYFLYLDTNELTDVTVLYDFAQLRVLDLLENNSIPCEQLDVFNDRSRFNDLDYFHRPDICI